MRNLLYILLPLLLVGLFSCNRDKKDFPIEPQIYHLYTNPNQINLSNPLEYVFIQLRFTDGDGDLGYDVNGGDSTIFLKDSRDTSGSEFTYVYPMPYIGNYARPKKGGLEGSITINLNNAYFSPKDSLHLAIKRDTVVWSVFIKDKVGHKSNVIHSDTIYIKY